MYAYGYVKVRVYVFVKERLASSLIISSCFDLGTYVFVYLDISAHLH